MPRVDDRRVLSGIIFINRNGLRWRDAPREYGPHKTHYNRWKRWSDMCVFARIVTGIGAETPDNRTISIDAIYFKAHRTASSLQSERGARPPDRKNQGRDEHEAPCGYGCARTADPVLYDCRRSQRLHRSQGFASSLPAAEWLLGDHGYDADWFREALADKGTVPCIPGRTSRGKPVKNDKRRYRKRNRIEIMVWRLKDWRRVATRHDRSPTIFLSAIALAATVIFCL